MHGFKKKIKSLSHISISFWLFTGVEDTVEQTMEEVLWWEGLSCIIYEM